MNKKLSVKDVRNRLHKLEYELHKYTGKNKLTSQYRMKVAYMLMWMRLIRINKSELKGWHMPDMNTITKMRKEGKEELKQKINKEKK